MEVFQNHAVEDKFASYPQPMRQRLLFLRQLVFTAAAENEGITDLEETLKWGEPSYCSSSGSPIRMDWKAATPDQYALYFHCQTSLIETFREIYGTLFKFEGKRAIVFTEDENIPVDELKHCIFLALTYHRRKHLLLLGVGIRGA